MTTNSSDVKIPPVLLQRYDSLSTGSESARSSLSSTSSSTSSSNRCHRRGQRRTKATRSKPEIDESAITSIQIGNTMTTDLETLQTEDSDGPCFLCNTMVNERQYYLWQSNFTKSSFCSRCIKDNNSLNYVSYWGTSCYKSGSWRERYAEGRSFDIDVTPLLEVLDRIERIDTSICGYKSNTKYTRVDIKPAENTTNARTTVEPCPKIEQIEGYGDYNLRERRQRRMLNRKSLTNTDSLANNLNDKLNTLKNKNELSRHAAVNELMPSTRPTSHIAIERSEPLQLSDVEVIEPLVMERAEEKHEMLSPHRPSKYAGQTMYDQFVAGLSDDSKLTRRSTTAYDLSTLGETQSANTECYENNKNVGDNNKVVPKQLSDITKDHDNVNNIKFEDFVSPEEESSTELDTERSMKQSKDHEDAEFVKTEHDNTKHQRNILSRRTHCIDKVLGYKKKAGEIGPHRRGRRYSRPQMEPKPLPNHNKENENITEDELTFIEKRHMFEIMQSDGYTIDNQTANILQGKFRSQYLEGTSNGRNGNTNDASDSNTYVPKTDTIESNDNTHARNNESRDTEVNSTCAEYQTAEVMDNTQELIVTLENISNNPDNPNLQHENKQHCIKYTEIHPHEQVSSEKTRLVSQEVESESSLEVSDNDNTNNTSSWNNEDLDLSSSISNTQDTSLSPNISGETDPIETTTNSDENRENNFPQLNRTRSKYSRRRLLQTSNDVQQTENKVKEVSEDVPHIERIKKKLGRSQNDDDELEEDKSYMEIDVCDNDQMELSWRTRGYNADFFMSRQSVTGSEIIDRYNQAISKRRRRRRAKATPFSYGQANDLDTLTTLPEDVSSFSRPKSNSFTTRRRRCDSTNSNDSTATSDSRDRQHTVRPKSHSFTTRTSVKLNEPEPVSDTHDGVNPVKLTEALTRARQCSRRLSRRLRSQLNECSEDSSSS